MFKHYIFAGGLQPYIRPIRLDKHEAAKEHILPTPSPFRTGPAAELLPTMGKLEGNSHQGYGPGLRKIL